MLRCEGFEVAVASRDWNAETSCVETLGSEGKLSEAEKAALATASWSVREDNVRRYLQLLLLHWKRGTSLMALRLAPLSCGLNRNDDP